MTTEWMKRLLNPDMDVFRVPHSVQQAIPVDRITKDGIFQCGRRYSKTFGFSDINYSVASEEEQKAMFLGWAAVLNSIDEHASAKITICNCPLDRQEFENSILIALKNDGLNPYRKEYNRMLRDKAMSQSGRVQQRYMTISEECKDLAQARDFFARTLPGMYKQFGRLSSRCTEFDAADRLRILYDFYRDGEEPLGRFDLEEWMRKGQNFKDSICPESLEFERDCFRMGDRYGRVLFLREYANYISDTMVSELCGMERDLILSLDVTPVPMDEAVRRVERLLLGVEKNIADHSRRQNDAGNYSAVVPYEMEQQRKELREFLGDLTARDQRMMLGTLTIVHVADSKQKLDSDTEVLKTIARQKRCDLGTATFQQLDGLNTVLPYGVNRLDMQRTLTTESTAVFMPFQVQEVLHPGGLYYGQNSKSRNMILVNRKLLLNGNSYILGVSGSGKSFAAKKEIVNVMLATDADVMVIDPERENSPLVQALGGEIIRISAESPNHINAMDMNRNYADGADPVALKTLFLLSLCEQLVYPEKLDARQKSLIDRCAQNVYRSYLKHDCRGPVPTLMDFHTELKHQPESEAQKVALAVELYATGTLNTFAKPTNVDVHNRLVCYDIKDLDRQLTPVGMLVVLDNIFNRITQNREQGRNTFIFIDEIYLMFQNEYSANFLSTLWKRVRKYGAFCTGITQNVEDLLQSHTARSMLANSEFIVMLKQAATDREQLARLLNISDVQLNYVTESDAGHGLIKVGASLIPFEDQFPKDTKLYKLMTTKPDELAKK